MKKYTLITGSSSGIGFELAKNISQYSNVILHGSRDYNEIEKLRLQLSNPKNHLIWCCNFSNAEDIFDNFKEFLSENNAVIEKYIHCAGIAPILSQKNSSYKIMIKTFNVNFFSAAELLRVLLKKKINGKYLNSVVFISSLVAGYGAAGYSLYGATKAALNGFMKSLAVELAPEIRINTVMPGAINTSSAKQVLNDKNILLNDKDILKKIKKTYLLGIGEVEDIANIVEYLISDKARWITGQNFIIDGGRSVNLNQT